MILCSLKWGQRKFFTLIVSREVCSITGRLKTEFQVWSEPSFVEMKEDNEQLRIIEDVDKYIAGVFLGMQRVKSTLQDENTHRI